MKEILLSTAAAWVWVYPLGMSKFKYKPLNCETCMAGWLCLILSVLNCRTWYEIPFYMAGAMVAVIILNGIISKL